MAWKSVRSIVALSILLATACGDDDDGGATTDTGLPPDQVLSELDSADAEQACNALVDSLENVLSADDQERINCTVAAVPESISVPIGGGQPQIDVGMCKELVNRCLGGEAIGTPGESPINLNFSEDITCDEPQVNGSLSDCDATVGEYEACINGWLAEIDRLFSAIDCDALRDPQDVQDTFGQGFDMASIAQCDALTAKCPSISFVPGSDDDPTGDQP